MRSSQERQEALVEEVKTLLKEKGKTLDPEVLARLAATQSGVEEDGASRFATFWRANRTLMTLLLAALFALLFFFLMGGAPESPRQPPGIRQGRVRTAH